MAANVNNPDHGRAPLCAGRTHNKQTPGRAKFATGDDTCRDWPPTVGGAATGACFLACKIHLYKALNLGMLLAPDSANTKHPTQSPKRCPGTPTTFDYPPPPVATTKTANSCCQ